MVQLSADVTELVVNADGRCAVVGKLPRVWLLNSAASPIEVAVLHARAAQASEALSSTIAQDRTAFSSRSYRYPYGLVAVHDATVGVDIERVDPYDEEFAHSICTPDEWNSPRWRPRTAEDLADVWSSKEAMAKGLGNAVDYDPRRLVTPHLTPDGRTNKWQAARVSVPSGFVAWVAWRIPDDPRS